MLSTTMTKAAVVPHQLLPIPTASIGILLLDKTKADSLLRTGDGSIIVSNGDIVIDSNNSREAGLVTGKGNVIANDIFVTGGLKHTGRGRFEGAITTGVTPTPDPLAALPEPTPVGPFFGAVNVGGHKSVTLSPGTYKGGISVSGNASVFLQPGIYYINGGGVTVSGNASLTGDGVTIFNGPAKTHAGFTFSGHAHVNLTAPTDGADQGIVLFQDRQSTAPLTVSAAGLHVTGTVYAANALFNISGDGNVFINGTENEAILASVIVKDLLTSGNNTLFVNNIASGLEGDLSITKEDDLGGSSIGGTTGTITPGGTITYTIVVTNNGPSNIVGANVNDEFPADVTSDTFTAVGSGGATGFSTSGSGGINDTVNLPSGATITYTVTANLSNTVTDLSNTATVTPPSNATDSDLTNNTATDTDTTVAAMVDLAITKTTPVNATVSPGGTATYTITVTNNGPDAATGATVSDTFGSQFTSDTFTAVGAGGATGFTASGTGNINDTVNVPVGGSIVYTVTGNISPTASGSLSNTGTVAAATGETDTNLSNNTAIATNTLVPGTNLTVTKVDNLGGSSINATTGAVAPGGTVTYTVVFRNTGPLNATGVKLSDIFPSTVSSDTFTAVGAGGATGFTASGTGNINDTANLPVGSSVTYTVTAHVSATAATGAVMANSAVVTPPAGLANINQVNVATDLDLITTGTTPSVDLAITKNTGATTTVPTGGTVTYTVTVTNAGPSTATGATVSDVLSSQFTSDTFTAVGAGGATGFTANGTGNINDTVNLPAGGRITYTVTGHVSATASGNLVNTGTVAAPPGTVDFNLANNTATATNALVPGANLTVTKVDNLGGSSTANTTGTVAQGGTVTYTIVFSNPGTTTTTGVKLSDVFPSTITSDTFTATAAGGATGFTATGAGNINDIVTMPAGSSVTYTVSGVVSPTATVGAVMANSAVVTPPTGVTNTNPVGVATDLDLIAAANAPMVNLGITKTTGATTTVTPGGQVTYTITVTNTGPSTATGARVTDNLGSQFTSDTFTAVAAGGATGFTASGSGNINDTVNVPVGGSIIYTVTGNISPTATGNLTNTGTVNQAAGTIDTNFANNTATATNAITPAANLTVSKLDNFGGSSVTNATGTAPQGGTITYTVVVSNTGPSTASGVKLADVLPTAITSGTFTATASGGATGFTSSGTGNLNETVNLPAGSSVTYTVTGHVSPTATVGSLLTNSAVITPPTGLVDTNPVTVANDLDMIAAANAPMVDLAISKTTGTTTTVTPGGMVTYTITVTNAGPSAATAARVSDTFGSQFTSDTFTAVGAGGATGFTASGSGNINDTVNVPVGGSIVYTVTGNISPTATGNLTNTGSVIQASGTVDTNAANNTAVATNLIALAANLAVSKVDNVGGSSITNLTGAVPQGGTVTYTVVLSNTGPNTATGVKLSDVMSSLITSDTFTATAAGGATGFTTSGTGNLNETVNLPAGSSVTYTVTGHVSPTAAPGTVLANSAVITPPTGLLDTNPVTVATDLDTVTPSTIG